MSGFVHPRSFTGVPFWTENPEILIRDIALVPNEDMTTEERMNAITRIIIIVFIIMLVLKYQHALTFLLIALIIVILMYYSVKRNEKRRSNYERDDHSKNHTSHGWERFEVKSGNKDEKPVTKQNPRVPFPPTVDSDLEVKASNKFGTVFNQQSMSDEKLKKFEHWLANVDGKSEPAPVSEPEIDIEAERQKNMMRAFHGGPKKNYRYVVEAEQDAEDSDDEVPPVEVSSRRFRPANYDPAQEDSVQPTIVPNPNRLRPGRMTSGKNTRRVPRYSDTKESDGKISGQDLMFNRAAKLEGDVKSRLRIDRASQINSIF